MRRWLVATAVLLLLLLAVELAAVPVATRAVGRALGRCLPYEQLEITAVGRPVTPGLLVGRVGDVDIDIGGVQVGELRVDRARIEVDRAVLPWAVGDPEPGDARVLASVLEADLEALLAVVAPLGLRPDLQLRPGSARIEVPPVPIGVEFDVTVQDGQVVIAPIAGLPSLWERLGLVERFDVPPGVQVDRIEVVAGELLVDLRVDLRVERLPGVDGTGECDVPFAAAWGGVGQRASSTTAWNRRSVISIT